MIARNTDSIGLSQRLAIRLTDNRIEIRVKSADNVVQLSMILRIEVKADDVIAIDACGPSIGDWRPADTWSDRIECRIR